MKKFTSLVALFLLFFGITASAQKVTVIESIDKNLVDITTLKSGDWVLLKNIQNGSGYLYELNNKYGFKGATISTGTPDFNQYLWQVTEEAEGYSFRSFAGNYLPVMVVGQDATPVSEAEKETFEVGKVSGNSNWYLKSLNATPHAAGASVYCKFQGGLQGGESTKTPNGGNGRMNFLIFKAKVVETDLFEVAKQEWRNTQGYVGGYTPADVDVACSKATLEEAQAYIAGCTKVALQTNVYYRMIAMKRNVAMSVTVGGQQFTEKEKLAEVDQLWQFVEDGANYKLLNVNHGQYLAKPVKGDKGNWKQNLVAEDAAVVFAIDDMGDAQHSLKFDNGTGEPFIGAGGGASNYVVTVAAASKSGDASWYFVPVTSVEVDMNAAEGATWSSLYLPFGVQLAEGVEAYAGKVNGNVMKLTAVDAVPANYGVILKGTAEKYTLNIANVEENTTENDLLGTNVEMPKTAASLVLGQNAEGVVGLYAPVAENLLANKAYLESPAAAANGLKFVFDDEITGIEGVETVTPADNIYYDLSGRRVAQPTKGIYVVNGKKVLVK